MKTIEFEGCNIIFAKDQSEYHRLPAFRANDGEVVTCWKLSKKEILKLLFTGKIWLSLLTFNKPLQPLKMSCDKPDRAKELIPVDKKQEANNEIRVTRINGGLEFFVKNSKGEWGDAKSHLFSELKGDFDITINIPQQLLK